MPLSAGRHSFALKRILEAVLVILPREVEKIRSYYSPLWVQPRRIVQVSTAESTGFSRGSASSVKTAKAELFDFHKFVYAIVAPFPTQTRLFDPSKGRDLGRHHAGTHLTPMKFSFLVVASPLRFQSPKA